jgi:hypothetical protein
MPGGCRFLRCHAAGGSGATRSIGSGPSYRKICDRNQPSPWTRSGRISPSTSRVRGTARASSATTSTTMTRPSTRNSIWREHHCRRRKRRPRRSRSPWRSTCHRACRRRRPSDWPWSRASSSSSASGMASACKCTNRCLETALPRPCHHRHRAAAAHAPSRATLFAARSSNPAPCVGRMARLRRTAAADAARATASCSCASA